MKSVIWKFPFDVEDEFAMGIPIAARFLKVDVQDNTPSMWFEVPILEDNENVNYEQRRFKVVGTGHKFDASWLDYRGTFMLLGGNFVGHVYEIIQPPTKEQVERFHKDLERITQL
jgi:hypothetical protein